MYERAVQGLKHIDSQGFEFNDYSRANVALAIIIQVAVG